MRSQQVRLLLIIGVIAVGTAVLSLAYCHDHPVAPPGAFDSTNTAESPGAVSNRVARPSADAVTDSSSERQEANAHLGDTQAEHSPEIDVAAGEREIVVLVIDGETNLPVPCTDVAYTDWSGSWSEMSSDDIHRWQSFGTDCFAQYRAFGSVAQTDLEGRVRLADVPGAIGHDRCKAGRAVSRDVPRQEAGQHRTEVREPWTRHTGVSRVAAGIGNAHGDAEWSTDVRHGRDRPPRMDADE